MISLLQLAKHKANGATHNRTTHANKAAHEHKDAHHATFAQAHAAEDADFLGLVNHHHNQATDDIECSHQNDKANHRRHDELFVVHPLKQRDIFRLPVHRVIRIT